MQECKVPSCANPVLVKKDLLCRMHYYRLRRTGTVELIDRKTYCSVDGCGKKVHGSGLCNTHWARHYRHGDPLTRLRQRDSGPDETRWQSKVSVEAPGCWLWTAGSEALGYGVYSVDRRSVRAHQYVYELLVGPVPDGLELDHLCRQRLCCNPDHLEPVTHLENVYRGASTRRDRSSPEDIAKRERHRIYMREYMRKRRASA